MLMDSLDLCLAKLPRPRSLVTLLQFLHLSFPFPSHSTQPSPTALSTSLSPGSGDKAEEQLQALCTAWSEHHVATPLPQVLHIVGIDTPMRKPHMGISHLQLGL